MTTIERLTPVRRCAAVLLSLAVATLPAAFALPSEAVPAEPAASAAPIVHQQRAEVSCEMTFTMKGWSAIFSKSEGEGTVTCDNGESADVKLSVTGGGLTFGKVEIENGKGTFTRTLTLPCDVDADKARAEFKDGILELTIPKVVASKRRTVTVE